MIYRRLWEGLWREVAGEGGKAVHIFTMALLTLTQSSAASDAVKVKCNGVLSSLHYVFFEQQCMVMYVVSRVGDRTKYLLAAENQAQRRMMITVAWRAGDSVTALVIMAVDS